jgi:hypothetical protein
VSIAGRPWRFRLPPPLAFVLSTDGGPHLTQIRSSGLRRLAVPIGLSLAAHALFVAFVWLAPSARPQNAGGDPDSPPCSFSVSRDQGRSEARLIERPPSGSWLPDEFDPTIVWDKKGTDVYVDHVPSAPANAGPSDGNAGGDGPSRAGASAPSIIAAPAQARRIAYVIDRSLSMGASGALSRAKVELIASLRGLPAGARFQVLAYNLSAQPLLSGGWLTPDGATLTAVELRLNDLPASGGTDHVGALRQAMLARPDFLFWVTDADELTEAGVFEVTRLNAAGTRIHVVELAAGHADGRGLLSRLAQNNGGTYRRVSPASPLDGRR